MASGTAIAPLKVEILVNDGQRRTKVADQSISSQSWVGAYGEYVTNIDDSVVYSFSQMHIHRYGRIIEINVVMTVKGMMLRGHPYTMFNFPKFHPMYAIRQECYGAQSDSDYAEQMGVVNLTTGGNCNFISYADVPSGGVRTFRFNAIFIAADP